MSLQEDALILHGLDDAIAGESDCGRLKLRSKGPRYAG